MRSFNLCTAGFSAPLILRLQNCSCIFSQDEAEYYSKMVNTATNLIGIGALVVGLIQVRSLVYRRNLGLEQLRASDQLDISLLRYCNYRMLLATILSQSVMLNPEVVRAWIPKLSLLS